MRIRAGVLMGLLVLTGCARMGQDPEQGSTDTATATTSPSGSSSSPTASPSDLSGIPAPELHAAGQVPFIGEELIVPSFCQPKAAGLARFEDGFFLVVQMEGAIPSLDEPPPLPFGVLLHDLEVRVGVFAPQVRADLGGSYLYVRQYQTPTRPKLQVGNLGEGKSEPVELVDDDVEANELRVKLPDVGDGTDDVTEWGVRVTCILHHPVEGFYFPSVRIPGKAPNTHPVTES